MSLPPSNETGHLAALTERHRADGVIVVSLPLSAPQLAGFRRAGVPLVVVDALARGVPQTFTDDVRGGRIATEHLLRLGHRRIGFVGDDAHRDAAGSLGFVSSGRRLTGYRQALAAAEVRYDPALVRRGPHDAATAGRLAADLLAMPDPPSAIFAASDTQALGVLMAAHAAGVRVPEQLSLVGFDDVEAASLLGLSTVRQPLEHTGAEGARRLCALLRGERIKPLRQQLALAMVQRASSAPTTWPSALLAPDGHGSRAGRPDRIVSPAREVR